MIDVEALHRAADRVGNEVGSPMMDQLAAAGAEFLHASNFSDEFDTTIKFDRASLGYGIMLGYLAALEEQSGEAI